MTTARTVAPAGDAPGVATERPVRSARAGLVAAVLVLTGFAALGDAPDDSDLTLMTRARTALGELRAFEQVNAEIVRRCHEPVQGAYTDWRDEVHVDLERAHALEKMLRGRLGDQWHTPPTEQQMQPFLAVEGQALFSRCLRWSTVLIQHESPIRADAAARLAFLRDNEVRLRAMLGNDAEWRGWRAAGAVP